MFSNSAIVLFALVAVHGTVFASPIMIERDINIETSQLDARNGFGFVNAAKQLMKERPDNMMKPMFDHVSNTIKNHNALKDHKNGASLWASTKAKIHAKHPDYQQMRINNRIAGMNNPKAQALHDRVKNHQHPREMWVLDDVEVREWDLDLDEMD
ncbi:hypothetical protein D9613_007326 [Agrocybe pediades]|uniref:Uncharacterized protein n=1 Tax=Agrocybe pediades TaxID=84607 RepID=A0A8H4VIN7_9AGAR|nr:hypothetical protein D9613_007326 [Agrocybe pediades]